jgi:hypothetical protein
MRYFIAFLIVGSLWIATASAQVLTDSVAPYRSVFGLHQWSVVAGGFILSSEGENLSGNATFERSSAKGARFGFNYLYSFKNNLAFEIGFHAGGFPLRYQFSLAEKDFPQIGTNLFDYYTEYTILVEIPLRLVYRHNIGSNWLLQLKGGTNIRVLPEQSLTIGHTLRNCDDINVRYLELYFRPISRVHLNAQVGAGVSYILPRLNMINLNLIYNYSPKVVVEGLATAVPNSSEESKGKFQTTGSYIGLELGYTFTNKRLRK